MSVESNESMEMPETGLPIVARPYNKMKTVLGPSYCGSAVGRRLLVSMEAGMFCLRCGFTTEGVRT